jgi:hypothetical protein
LAIIIIFPDALAVMLAALLTSPAPNGFTSETRCVRVATDFYPIFVLRHVVEAEGGRLPQLLVQEILDLSFFWLSGGTPFTPAVLEIAYQFLLFRV